jgi:adenosylhomocysteinase
MSYHFDDSQLRVVQKYTRQRRNADVLKGTRIILLEHILPTTEQFIQHINDTGAEIFCIVAKPYSIDAHVLARLQKFRVISQPYHQLETTTVLDDLLKEAVEKSKEDNKQILILEVGGYFAKPLTRIDPDHCQFIAGVVEDTTFGHNRYKVDAPNIPVPIFSVARSPLKEIEARFVGTDAVSAIESVLRSCGISIAGRKALVIGYGMIGSNVAKALRNYGLTTCVYDKNDATNLRAYIDGFPVHKKSELVGKADIIFAATADRALTWPEMEECKDNVILASVGSKNTEFDIETLEEQQIRRETLNSHLERFTTQKSKSIIVANNGTAVNFILPSLPVEILDIVFAEIFLCSILLLKQDRTRPEYPPGELHVIPGTYLNEIAKDWVRNVNI